MRAIMIMFDSLNSRMLEPYGCDWIKTPNFNRLAKHSVAFDCNYVGSMPCMPARREIHTGRYNFQHRGWGPMEPFDDSMPEILKNNGIYTHIVTDHQHYWEDGGGTYHTRYNSFELVRGQEGDPWKALPELINPKKVQSKGYASLMGKLMLHDQVNRKFMDCEDKMPQAVTFKAGLDFIDDNQKDDNWFLTIETFDPHEPFYTQDEYKRVFTHEYDGPMGDWPPYYYVTEGEDSISHIRYEYAALITMCDRYLGKVLDAMDKYNMWEDTMLIVNTDHGYLLGEHGWWSKTVMPVYEEIARTPMFLYDPRNKIVDERRGLITQTIDIPATLLEFFNVLIPKDMQGRPLNKVVEDNKQIHEAALFGYHESHCIISDGTWVYMKAPVNNNPLYEYTLMPAHMRSMFAPDELQDIQLQEPFEFTKGCRTMKIQAKSAMNDPINFGTKLYNLKKDPKQENPVYDIAKETEMANKMIKAMHENDCPLERFERFGFPSYGNILETEIEDLRRKEKEERIPESLSDYLWEAGALNMYHALLKFFPEEKRGEVDKRLSQIVLDKRIKQKSLIELMENSAPEELVEMIRYFVMLSARTQ